MYKNGTMYAFVEAIRTQEVKEQYEKNYIFITPVNLQQREYVIVCVRCQREMLQQTC
jgi:hypothetical protein